MTLMDFNVFPKYTAFVDDDNNQTVFLGKKYLTSSATFPNNITEQPAEELSIDDPLKSVCFLIAALGLIGNFVTIAKIVYDSKLHKPTYAAIGYLAFADFFSLIVVTIHLLMATSMLEFEKLWIQLTVVFISDTINISSACHVLLLSSVRFLITVRPLQSRRLLTIKAVSLCSLSVWLISFLFGFIKSYLFYVHLQTKSHFLMLINGITYLIALFLVCFITISLHVWKIKAIQVSIPVTRHVQKRMNFVVTTIMAVYAIFQIFVIMKSLYIYSHFNLSFRTTKVYVFLHLSVILTAYLTYSINPYIFFFLSIFLSCTRRRKLKCLFVNQRSSSRQK